MNAREQAEAVRIDTGAATIEGDLALTGGPIVVFAHGSGSSRHSPRNQQVAAQLRHAGLGTLLIDLLTPEEEASTSAPASSASASTCSRAA